MQQKSELSRIIFLNLFVKEMILTKYKEYEVKYQIEVEKIRKKFIENNISEENSNQTPYNQIMNNVIANEELNQKENNIVQYDEEENLSMANNENVLKKITSPITEKRKQTIYRGRIVKRPEMKNFFLKKPNQIIPKKQEIIPIKQNTNLIEQIRTTPNRNGPVIGLINPLLKDNSIIVIECPGPGKNIIVKKYNQINVTKIILNEPEIKSIIEYFANEARIPLVGGILKAAVGNSIISAIVSEFVGSRFIINKTTPYSLLNRK